MGMKPIWILFVVLFLAIVRAEKEPRSKTRKDKHWRDRPRYIPLRKRPSPRNFPGKRRPPGKFPGRKAFTLLANPLEQKSSRPPYQPEYPDPIGANLGKVWENERDFPPREHWSESDRFWNDIAKGEQNPGPGGPYSWQFDQPHEDMYNVQEGYGFSGWTPNEILDKPNMGKYYGQAPVISRPRPDLGGAYGPISGGSLPVFGEPGTKGGDIAPYPRTYARVVDKPPTGKVVVSPDPSAQANKAPAEAEDLYIEDDPGYGKHMYESVYRAGNTDQAIYPSGQPADQAIYPSGKIDYKKIQAAIDAMMGGPFTAPFAEKTLDAKLAELDFAAPGQEPDFEYLSILYMKTVQDDCFPNPCYNGGTCVEEDGMSSCLCDAPYYGTYCEKRIWI